MRIYLNSFPPSCATIIMKQRRGPFRSNDVHFLIVPREQGKIKGLIARIKIKDINIKGEERKKINFLKLSFKKLLLLINKYNMIIKLKV